MESENDKLVRLLAMAKRVWPLELGELEEDPLTISFHSGTVKIYNMYDEDGCGLEITGTRCLEAAEAALRVMLGE